MQRGGHSRASNVGGGLSQVCPCLHLFRNALRALPCRPCLSASIEHSFDFALCPAFGAAEFLTGTEDTAPGAMPGAAVGLCAQATPENRHTATAVEESLITDRSFCIELAF